MSRESYIVSGFRTAIGNFRGSLSPVRTDDLAAIPIKSLISYLEDKLEISKVDEVVLGCANQAGEDNRNIARMSGLLAGLPSSVPGETVNRLCASGMSSVIHAHRAIISKDADLVVAGGIEHMTRAPWVTSKSSVPYGNDAQMFDTSFGWRFVNPLMKEMYGTEAMGETAENLASIYEISRDEQDRFALWSQMKASQARSHGRFEREIVPVRIPQKKMDDFIFDEDEFIKEKTNLDILSKLRPAFKNEGSVTAGNSSGLNDGAAAILVASNDYVEKYNLNTLAKIISSAVVGVSPSIMGIGPVSASIKALGKANLTMDDMDVIEINEAFAVQVLSCLKELKLSFDDPRINPNGGAIALGHPLGMTGTRLLLTAAHELNIKKKRYALVTMCIGVGQGYAVILENTNI